MNIIRETVYALSKYVEFNNTIKLKEIKPPFQQNIAQNVKAQEISIVTNSLK